MVTVKVQTGFGKIKILNNMVATDDIYYIQ